MEKNKTLKTKIQKFLRSINLKKRLNISLLILSILPILFITFFSTVSTYKDAEKKNREYVINVSSQVTNNIEFVFEKYIDKLNRVSYNSSILADVYNYAENPNYRNSDIATRIKIALASTVGTTDGVVSIGIFSHKDHRFYYGEAIESIYYDSDSAREDDIVWSLIYNKYIYLTKLINFQYGKNSIGYSALKINGNYVDKVTQENSFGNEHEIIVLDDHNGIISHNNKNLLYTKMQNELISKLEKSNTSGNKSDNVIEINIDNEPYYASYNKISQNNWKIINLFSKNNLMKGTYNNIKTTVILTLIFGLLSFYLMHTIIKSIRLPVINLIKNVEKVGRGDLDVKIEEDTVNVKDEHKELTDNFNKMTKRLKNLIDDVYNSKIKEKELEYLREEAELNALQQQIDPHFLYNILEAIFWKAQLNGHDEIGEMISALGNFFRTSINKGFEHITINNEISNVKNYIYLQKIRLGEKFKVNYEIEEEVLNYKTIKLILQPIVENAIIHGIQNSKESGIITIRCYRNKQNISFEIEDNGIGMKPEKVKSLQAYIDSKDEASQKSVGVKNVNQRIKLYFGNKFGVRIISKYNEGTKIIITIPAFTNEMQLNLK